jgi:hypothetical protein
MAEIDAEKECALVTGGAGLGNRVVAHDGRPLSKSLPQRGRDLLRGALDVEHGVKSKLRPFSPLVRKMPAGREGLHALAVLQADEGTCPAKRS